MEPAELNLRGKVRTDPASLDRFSRDASSYRIKPRLVVEPVNEADVLAVLAYSRKTGESITCRSGGSGLSGAGIGPGILLNFKPSMNRIKGLEKELAVEPGVVLEDFVRSIRQRGLMLPAIPSSSAWCALGGNIGTRSTGPRTARYGTIDSFVSSLRFVTAGGEVVDTRERLPAFLENGLMAIRDRYLADAESRALFEKRPFIAGGYNIRALSGYEDPRDIATHLLVGSIGTLGVVTEIRLDLVSYRASQGTFAAHFRSLDELGEAVDGIRRLNPAAVEFVDAGTLSRLDGRLLNAKDADIKGTLLVEFDESREQAEEGRKLLASFDRHQLVPIAVASPAEAALWEERRRILPSLRAYAAKRGWILPSVIDDMAIHVSDFVSVYKDLQQLMAELNHEICIFGHVGFGSLHARPFFDPRRGDIRKQITAVSSETFGVLHRYGGTLVGEHNAGRSRSVYLEMELGESLRYLRDIKTLFDPDDRLNPNTVFDLAPITDHLDLSR